MLKIDEYKHNYIFVYFVIIANCKPVTCEIYCRYGWAKDENGCDICSCNDRPTPPTCAAVSIFILILYTIILKF